MTKLFLALFVLSLSGCGASECLDAQFPRRTERLPGSHIVELAYGVAPPLRVEVSCEKYYDAMCSERGNYWSIRELGSTAPMGTIKFLPITDPALGKVEIERPSCELFSAKPPRFPSVVRVAGHIYSYSRQDEGGYTYSSLEYVPGKPQSLNLHFSISVDGSVLRPPQS